MNQTECLRWLEARKLVEAVEPVQGRYREPSLVTGQHYVVLDSDNDMLRVLPVGEPKTLFGGTWVGIGCLRLVHCEDCEAPATQKHEAPWWFPVSVEPTFLCDVCTDAAAQDAAERSVR